MIFVAVVHVEEIEKEVVVVLKEEEGCALSQIFVLMILI
jgi:hypothetical protein